MIRKIPEDVQAAIDAKVASGKYANDETVLREALASHDEFDEVVAKLQTAIDDWTSGDVGMPIDQVVELVRGRVEGRGESANRHSQTIVAIDNERNLKTAIQN